MNKKFFSLTCALVTSFIWGTAFVAQDIGMDHIGPLTFTSARLILGFLTLLPFVILIDLKKIKNNNYDFKKIFFYLLFIGFLIVWATRSREQISELQKDVCTLRKELDKNIEWTQNQQERLVQLRAEQDVANKQITSLWDLYNKMREKVH